MKRAIFDTSIGRNIPCLQRRAADNLPESLEVGQFEFPLWVDLRQSGFGSHRPDTRHSVPGWVGPKADRQLSSEKAEMRTFNG
jgi:hypothetical protein